MLWSDLLNELTQEALMLDPGNLKGCGTMLKLLDQLDIPAAASAKETLKNLLEDMILGDLEGKAPSVDQVMASVEVLSALLKRIDAGEEIPVEAPVETATTAEAPPVAAVEPSFPDLDAPEPVATQPAPAETIPSAPGSFIPEDPALLRDFSAEANEHLNSIEINLVEWEKNASNHEIINSIFRPFHTIKGVAGFLNLQEVNRTAHQLENLLDECREGRLTLSPDLSDLIFDGVDILRGMIGAVETAIETTIAPDYSPFDLATIFKRIGNFLDASKRGEPPQTGASKPLGEILVESGKVRQQDLQHALDRQAALEESKPLGEILVEEDVVSRRDIRDAVRKQQETTQQPDKFIKVDTTKLDQLLDMVGELVISQSMVTQNPELMKITDQRFAHDISQLIRVTKTLQTISMSMRLVPIGATFQKMNRIVRDLSRKSGKLINLVLEGQSAEIDRNMVEELYDPLVHMIRNSCDHGISTPDNRREKGKSEEGTIVLKAEHAGGKVVITISDDGEGLNRDAILSKARDKGLIGPDETPEDKVIYGMIMMAGFSTAKQITDVSGRGVGMDVVKKTIEKLRGTVEIQSTPGVGTVFTIKLPLTTAIIDGMLVQVGEERFIIPTLSVRQLVRPEPGSITIVVGKGEMATVRGRLIPITRLHRFLAVDNAKENILDAVLVLVEDNNREVALVVDNLLGKQEVVIKNLGEKMNNLRGIAGSAILGDGRVALILDIAGLITSDNGNGATVTT